MLALAALLRASGAGATEPPPSATRHFKPPAEMPVDELLRVLAGPACPVRGLDLRGQRRGAAFVGRLVDSAEVSCLQILLLRDNGLGPGGAAALASSTHLDGMRILDLGENKLGDEGARRLAGSTRLAGLRELGLGDNDITSAGLVALAATPMIGRLEALDISNNDLSDGRAARQVFVAAAGLTTLFADQSNCKHDCIEALIQSGISVRLVQLRLSGNDLDARSAASLAAAPFPRLVSLFMAGNSDLDPHARPPRWIGSKGAAAIGRSSHFPRLTELYLPLNSVGDAGLRSLIGSRNLTQLKRLGLRGNDIGDRGARALMASPRLDQLESLDLEDNQISGFELRRLRQRLGQRLGPYKSLPAAIGF